MSYEKDVPSIEFLKGDLAVLQLRPGDIVVVSFPDWVSEANIARLRETMAEAFPANRAMLLEGGVRLGVVRAAATNEGGEGAT